MEIPESARSENTSEGRTLMTMRFWMVAVTVIALTFAVGLGLSQGKEPTVLLLVSPTKNHPAEYGVTRHVLESSQCKVNVACKVPYAKDTNGRTIPVDLTLEQVRPGDYEAVAIIGGYSVWKYVGDPEVNRLLLGFCDSDKHVGAICAGTYVLGKAGLLKDRRVTGATSRKLRNYGAKYVGGLVQQDGKIITAQGPSASEAFGKALAEAVTRTLRTDN